MATLDADFGEEPKAASAGIFVRCRRGVAS
jgi:hypothetical protein